MATNFLIDGNVVDQVEAPVVGATVYIYDSNGLASTFDELGQAIKQPIVTGEDGYWSAYVADQRLYTVKYYWGGRLRLTDANRYVGSIPLAVESSASAADAAASALASKQAAENSESAAENSETNAAASEANALQSANDAQTYRDTAEVARDSTVARANLFASTAAALGNGVVGSSTLVGGSSGTDGTFTATLTGGTEVVAGQAAFTVSGGAVTEVTITKPGYYTSAPTGFDFSASSGLTGASATPITGANTVSGEYFQIPSASGEGYVDLYFNNSGSASALVATLPNKSKMDGVIAALPTRELTGAVAATENMFNKDDPDVVENFYVDPGDGLLVANSGYDSTHYIPVDPSTAYYANHASAFFAWFDSNQAYINATGRSGNVYTSPAGAAYLRYSVPVPPNSLDTFYIRKGSTALDAYERYGGKILPGALEDIPTFALKDAAVTPPKTSFMEQRKNLFRKSTAALGYYAANGSGPTGTTYSHNTDLIAVTAGQDYVCNTDIRFLTAYDAGGAVISAEGSNTQIAAGTVITPATGVAFYRLSVLNSSVATCQFEAGTTSTGYSDWGFDLASFVGAGATTSLGAWNGKTVAFLGDSLTSQGAWIDPMVAALGLIEGNYGIGGTRLSGNFTESIWQDVRINAIPTTVDAVVMMGGTNDWANNVAIGSESDTDPTTSVYGALNTIADKLKARFPTKMIFFGTVPLSAMTLPRSGFIDTYTNNQGTIDAYNDAVRTVAQRESFALIDFYREAGFHDQNLTSYMSDDGNRIHPNPDGGERMASVGIGRLRDLQPVE